MIGRLINLSPAPGNRKQHLTIEIDSDFRAEFDELHGKTVDVSIKKYRPKRSLDANAYAWVLMDKLAEAMGITKVEVYREAIRGIGGVSETVPVLSEAVEKFCEIWEARGLGWQCERFPSKLPGCVNVTLYYGSSAYDTKQMSRLIEQLIEDCRAIGIETKTQEEIDSLLQEWGLLTVKRIL